MAKDKHGFTIKEYPDGLTTVYKSVENCEELCGLDRKVIQSLLKGNWNQTTCLDHTGRTSKKIIIEYDIKHNEE